MKIVSYIRVSTAQQGSSGLGLEAQTAAIDAYTAAHGAETVGAFIEIESGKNNSRPELQKAIKAARICGARLVIAKLDRLSRSASFLLNLRDAGVDFVAVDMPDANAMTVGIMAIVAENEAKAISDRTKQALQAAKARGTALGNPNGADALRRARKGNGASVAVTKQRADARAHDLADVLEAIGPGSLRYIAAELNRRGIKTARGGKWHATSVKNLQARLPA
ncbi:Site-specific DNA recombinase [Palleronia salina]|uniref:Site-specific DNA recombinase n=1 Tax=Palleronia salina TaxID=313368 RepID=A0A1M6M5C9_9RHOB|nr:recombinase family protein [Palleronia salina]SHJ78675.1 Site-specific DNA recombinase [Palleronia salina]